MIEEWRRQLSELSGNLTTNEAMPQKLIGKLLDEDISLKDKLLLEDVSFSELNPDLQKIKGLDILSGLQKKNKKDCLTLFRAIRFPTYKRLYEIVSEYGYAITNYEQERISELYRDEDYIQKRDEIKSDQRFWTQPQERVVHGLPLFCLVNDALQIHRAFRDAEDKVVIVAIHIPHELFKSGKIKLIANTAIDLDYNNDDRDFKINDFYKEGNIYEIDFESLRTRGIDLHEMYTSDMPQNIKEAQEIGIEQEFFLVDIYKITDVEAVNDLFKDTKTLKRINISFMGFLEIRIYSVEDEQSIFLLNARGY